MCSLLQRRSKEFGLGLRKGRTDGEITILKVFYPCYQFQGRGVSHSHSEYFCHHTSKLVSCLGPHCPIELSAMIEMFQWCAGAGFDWLVEFIIAFSGIL